MKNPSRTLRKILVLALILGRVAPSMPVGAAAPREINYQGRLSDAVGNPLSGSHNIRFRICDSAAAPCASPLYDQTASGVSVTNGVFSVRLGAPPMAAVP